MNQPPPAPKPSSTRPDWLRPAGVSEGTWAYTQQRSIADHYGDFVAGTPLCALDQQFLDRHFARQNSSAENLHTQRIIDFGCGNGRSLIPLAANGFQTIGVDLSQPMLVNAVKSSAATGIETPTRWIRANLVQLDCIDGDTCDHAICLFSTLGMIQGRKNRRQFLQHARRIVRDGGTFVLHVHCVWSALGEPGGWNRLAKSALNSLSDRQCDFGDHVYAYRGLSNMFLHRFRWSEVRADLIDSGWKVQQRHLIADDGITFTRPRWYHPQGTGGFLIVAN